MLKERNRGISSGKRVLEGAALLAGAALLSKLIGTLQKIPLQNMAGDEAFGLYSAVYALAVMWMTLAAAGIPTAVSLLVAERESHGPWSQASSAARACIRDEAGAQRVVRWSLGLMCATGFAAFIVMQAGANGFARWIGAPEAALAIRASSFALLFAPAAAVLRGYRQGQMRMARPAVSQILEQTARVAFMLVMLIWAVGAGWSASATAAAVHGGLAAGAVVGLAVMLWPERSGYPQRAGDRGPQARPDCTNGGAGGPPARIWQFQETRSALVKRIVGAALPIAAASAVTPLFGLIDAFTIPRFLQQAGAGLSASIAQFGVYNRGIALLQLVLVAASGAAAALVPALTAARSGESGPARESAERAALPLRLAWWFGGAAAVGLALLASPIDVALFGDDSGSAAILLMAPAAVFGSLQAVSSGMLQGQGDLRSPAVNLAAATVFKLALNVLLVPAYGITGAAAGASAAYGAAALLNALSLRGRLDLPAVRLASAWRPASALAAMAAAVALTGRALGALTGGLPDRAAALLVALPGTAVGAAVFAAALIASGAVGPQLWRELPGCAEGSRLDNLLARLQASVRRRAAASSTTREG